MIVLTLVGLEKVWGLVEDRVEIGTSRGSLAYGYGIGIGNGGSGLSTVPGIGRGFGQLSIGYTSSPERHPRVRSRSKANDEPDSEHPKRGQQR